MDGNKKNQRKPRAIHKSANDTKKILSLHNQGMKPMEIFRFCEGKYSYFQIYNTINPRDAKSSTTVDEKGKIKEVKINADKTVTEMPPIDYSQFPSFEKFIEHEITVIVSQINEKKITLEKRVDLLRKLSIVNKQMKAQMIEQYLKNGNAKIIIAIMRRMQPDISDEEITRIFKEESEKLKKLNK